MLTCLELESRDSRWGAHSVAAHRSLVLAVLSQGRGGSRHPHEDTGAWGGSSTVDARHVAIEM